MKPQLQRKFFVFEFILTAHMIFCFIVEIQSVVFPDHLLAKLIENQQYVGKKNPHANHNDMFDYLSFFGFLFWLSLKYIFEGLRVNTSLICLAEIVFFMDRAIQTSDKILCQVGMIMTMLYTYTIFAFPCYNLPEPNGPYKVGYRNMQLSDSQQTKIAIFYPTDDPMNSKLTKVQVYRISQQINWSPKQSYNYQIIQYLTCRSWNPCPEFILNWIVHHLSFHTFSCLLNAKLLEQFDEQKKFPLIILSHGLSCHFHSFSSFAKQWASLGFIVICPQHEEDVYPWDSTKSKIKFRNNKPEILQLYKSIRGHHLDWRVQQIRAIIDTFQNKASISEIFDQECEIDMNTLTIIGHSFGGATAIKLAQIDQRVKGIISIDPWLFPMKFQDLDTQILKNTKVLILNKELNSQKDELYNQFEMKKFIEANQSISDRFIALKLKGMDHAHPTDLCFFIPSEMEVSRQLRQSENILQIHESISTIVNIFYKNYIAVEINQINRDKFLLVPFNDWSSARWKSNDRLIQIN